MGKILLEGIEVMVRIGLLEEELYAPQDLLVSLEIENDFSKLSIKKQFEKGWPNLQVLAKMAGYGISKNKQAKNRTFRYDLRK